MAGIEVMFHSQIKEAINKIDILCHNNIIKLDKLQILDITALLQHVSTYDHYSAVKEYLTPNLWFLNVV